MDIAPSVANMSFMIQKRYMAQILYVAGLKLFLRNQPSIKFISRVKYIKCVKLFFMQSEVILVIGMYIGFLIGIFTAGMFKKEFSDDE